MSEKKKKPTRKMDDRYIQYLQDLANAGESKGIKDPSYQNVRSRIEANGFILGTQVG